MEAAENEGRSNNRARNRKRLIAHDTVDWPLPAPGEPCPGPCTGPWERLIPASCLPRRWETDGVGPTLWVRVRNPGQECRGGPERSHPLCRQYQFSAKAGARVQDLVEVNEVSDIELAGVSRPTKFYEILTSS